MSYSLLTYLLTKLQLHYYNYNTQPRRNFISNTAFTTIVPRESQFNTPGYHMVSFAADAETSQILNDHKGLYGDRSKAIRALILEGANPRLHGKVLEQERLLTEVRLQHVEIQERLREAQDALREAQMSQDVTSGLLEKSGIDWLKYPAGIREELQEQYLAKHQ